MKIQLVAGVILASVLSACGQSPPQEPNEIGSPVAQADPSPTAPAIDPDKTVTLKTCGLSPASNGLWYTVVATNPTSEVSDLQSVVEVLDAAGNRLDTSLIQVEKVGPKASIHFDGTLLSDAKPGVVYQCKIINTAWFAPQ